MKKIITFILILLMVIPMFISCSGDTPTSAKTDVTAPPADTTAEPETESATEPATEPVTTAAVTEAPQTTAVTQAAASSVTLNATEFTLDEGYSVFLKAILSSVNAAESMTWSSSESSVATVDSTGKVTAKSAGNAIAPRQ
jgi:uncharacterized protein YjdB